MNRNSGSRSARGHPWSGLGGGINRRGRSKFTLRCLDTRPTDGSATTPGHEGESTPMPFAVQASADRAEVANNIGESCSRATAAVPLGTASSARANRRSRGGLEDSGRGDVADPPTVRGEGRSRPSASSASVRARSCAQGRAPVFASKSTGATRSLQGPPCRLGAREPGQGRGAGARREHGESDVLGGERGTFSADEPPRGHDRRAIRVEAEPPDRPFVGLGRLGAARRTDRAEDDPAAGRRPSGPRQVAELRDPRPRGRRPRSTGEAQASTARRSRAGRIGCRPRRAGGARDGPETSTGLRASRGIRSSVGCRG